MGLLLETKKLEAFYGLSQVLFGIDFALEEGDITTILGANGAGKTTTLKSLCGMVKTTGEISFDGHRIDGKPTEGIIRLGIAHVPDGRGTFTDLTVEENLHLGAYTRKDKDGVKQTFNTVYNLFPILESRRKQQAGTLSGGEQQMLALARGMMLKPRVLLLDEPSFGLAPLIVQELFKTMRVINEEEGVSLLVVEQNATLAFEIADYAYLLETGRVVLSGPADEMKDDETVRRSYLGY
jgi:branched-chain amino acid transport system ATP-binding protein